MYLYKVVLMGNFECYTIANDPTKAYNAVRNYFEKYDLGFKQGRELKSVEVIASDRKFSKVKWLVFDKEEDNLKEMLKHLENDIQDYRMVIRLLYFQFCYLQANKHRFKEDNSYYMHICEKVLKLTEKEKKEIYFSSAARDPVSRKSFIEDSLSEKINLEEEQKLNEESEE